jgi:uncharacterized protein YyaL (SSP411 family)
MNRFVVLLILVCASAKAADSKIPWEEWSPAAFAKAKQENKFVILDLHAVWCHWCHVMDETTYKDPRVIKLLADRYVPVGVDQDSRPDISNRYEDFGWPATIVFNGDGQEIVKRRGYLTPDEMASMLQAIIDDPTPGPSVREEKPVTYAKDGVVSPERSADLAQIVAAGYDRKLGGWGFNQKYLYWDAVERCLDLAAAGDKDAEKMARDTLRLQLQLIDPVWGGVYQYSAEGDWKHPHFEKIMQVQAQNMRIYARAYAQWKNPEYLKAAHDIQRFITTFLTSPDGAFYTSMDADLKPGEHAEGYFKLGDAARRKKGIPRIDKHIYARENGWMIEGLLALHDASGDEDALARAKRAADWIMANRSLSGGGFRHDETDAAGPFLGDTLAMGRAFLALHAATGERSWLDRAQRAADFIAANFRSPEGAGFVASKAGATPPPQAQFDENVELTRFANLLFHYTGNDADREMASVGMRYLATPDITGPRRAYVAGVLLAAAEFDSEPLHVTIVGPKGESAVSILQNTALTIASGYRQIELWDPASGQPASGGVEYPNLPKPAAFLCAKGTCSAPLETPDALRARLERISKPK